MLVAGSKEVGLLQQYAENMGLGMALAGGVHILVMLARFYKVKHKELQSIRFEIMFFGTTEPGSSLIVACSFLGDSSNVVVAMQLSAVPLEFGLLIALQAGADISLIEASKQVDVENIKHIIENKELMVDVLDKMSDDWNAGREVFRDQPRMKQQHNKDLVIHQVEEEKIEEDDQDVFMEILERLNAS
ncbi:hypothetical protein ACFE04_004252 [Oxalis oulophora]